MCLFTYMIFLTTFLFIFDSISNAPLFYSLAHFRTPSFFPFPFVLFIPPPSPLFLLIDEIKENPPEINFPLDM